MKKAVAKLLAEALRSKQFKQIDGALKTKSRRGVVRHCCLGVLCELYQSDRRRKKKPVLRTRKINPEVVDSKMEVKAVFAFGPAAAAAPPRAIPDSSGLTLLPEAVRKWAGLATSDGTFQGYPEQASEIVGHDLGGLVSLASLNDRGVSFKKIADIVEAEAANL